MKHLLWIGVLGVLACGQKKEQRDAFDIVSESIDELNQNSVKYEWPDLKGQWYLRKWDLFHTLHFIDEQNLVMDNHIDTILRFRYVLKNDTLLIWNEEMGFVENKINRLTKDTIVFEELLDKKDLMYIRKKPVSK